MASETSSSNTSIEERILTGPSIANIPPAMKRLIARPEACLQIGQELETSGKIVVCGEIGIGKTQTCHQYAREHLGSTYKLIWRISGDTVLSFLNSYRTLAQALKYTLPCDEDQIPSTMHQLLQLLPNCGWLLIFDDMTEAAIAKLMPEGLPQTKLSKPYHHIVLGSRQATWSPSFVTYTVPLLPKELAMHLILLYRPTASVEVQSALFNQTNGHPFSLVLLLCAFNSEKLHNVVAPRLEASTPSSAAVSTPNQALKTSIHLVTNVLGAELMENLSKKKHKEREEAEMAFAEARLIAKSGNFSKYLERLKLIFEKVKAITDAPEMIIDFHIEIGFANAKLYKLEEAIGHYKTALNLLKDIPGPHILGASCYNELAEAYLLQGDYKQCHATSLLGLQLLDTLMATNPQRTAEIIYRKSKHHMLLGACERQAGKLRAAANYFALAVASYDESSPKEEKAYMMFALADTQAELCDFAESERNMREVVKIRKEVFGPDDERYIIALNSMARVLALQEKYSQALPLIDIALQYHRNKNTGTPETKENLIRSLDSAGEVHMKCARFSEAKSLFEEALSMCIAAGETDTECIADLYHKLGVCSLSLDDLPSAMPLFEKALPIMESLNSDPEAIGFLKILLLNCKLAEM